MDDLRQMFTETFWDERYSGCRPDLVGPTEPAAGGAAG